MAKRRTAAAALKARVALRVVRTEQQIAVKYEAH